MADRSPHPKEIRVPWKWAAIGINAAPRVIVLVEHERIFRCVHKLKWIGVEINPRHAGRIAFREHRIVRRFKCVLAAIGGFGIFVLRLRPGR